MKKSYTMLTLVLISILGIILIGINKTGGSPATDTSSGKLRIVASLYPLAYFAAEIGGEKVQVHTVTPPGAEPHEYEPTARQLANIESSNIIIINGGQLEPWADRIKQDLTDKQTPLIIAGEGLTDQTMDDNGQTVPDPHVWLSPLLAQQQADRILAGLLRTDPQNANYYQSNTKQLMNNLDALNNEYMQGLHQCTKKDIITSHNAFAYLAKTYGLRQVSISGLSTDEEPSSKQLAEITDFAKENDVKYIFFERLVSPKLSETLAQEVGAQTLVLDPLEGLTEQDMQDGKNYITIMKDNLTNLRLALECQ